MPYYKEKNILFIHIPKTGGTVIEDNIKKKFKQTLYSGVTNNLLSSPYDKISLQHQFYTTIYNYKDKLSVDFKNIKVFTSVRNPYDRIISDLFWYKLIEKDYSSDQVLDVIKNNYINRTDLDNHNVPQYKFIVDKDEKLFSHIKIFKTEFLNEDNKKINDYLNININIKKNNVNKDYSRYLNEESISIINEIYKKDFIFFNYTLKINNYNIPKIIENNNKNVYDIFIFHFQDGNNILEYSLKNKGYSVFNVLSDDNMVFNVIEESMKQKETVYIIDIYKTPIERKIFNFFYNMEIGIKSFSNYKKYTCKQLIKYFNIKHLQKIKDYTINRDIFNYLNIKETIKYIDNTGYQTYNYKNIVVVKIYFENIEIWDKLFTKILGKEINLINSEFNYYKRYKEFLKFYKVPKKYLLEVIQNDHEFHKFVSPQKRSEYINKWLLRICNDKF
jgi:hypothetical protein